MNLIIFFQDGTIKRVVTNAVRKAGVVEGDNGKWVGKPDKFQLVWTSQTPTPVYDDENNLTGYVETINDFTPETPPAGREQPDKMSHENKLQMLEKLDDLASISFDQIDPYIDENITNLNNAKTYLKKLSKVVLALIKITQDNIK